MKFKQNTGGGSSFEPVAMGCHPAVCIAVVGIGEQTFEWQGKEKKLEKVLITWEVPSQRRSWTDKNEVEHEGPATITHEYTNSTHEKSILQKHLKGWRGRAFTAQELLEFDIKNLLGTNCQLMITHTQGKKDPEKTYANVETVIAADPKAEKLTPESDLVYYDADDHTQESFNQLKEWQQKKVILPDGTCPHVEGSQSGDVVNNNAAAANGPIDETEDIPF